MADDVILNAVTTTGDTIAADDVGGKKYQRVKIALGQDGVYEGDVSSTRSLPVSGDITAITPGTDATSLGKAIGSPQGATDTGVALLAVRKDTASLTTDDGDYSPLSVDSNGNLRVTSAGETQYAEDSVHVSGDQVTMAGVVQQSADAALAGDGDRTCLQTDASGFLKTTLKTAIPAGSNTIGNVNLAQYTPASGRLPVDGSGVTQPVSGTVAVTQATASNLKVDLSGTAANATAIKVDGSAVTQPVSMATNQPVGTVAHDSVDSGNPLKVGAKATTSLSGVTLVASADRTDLLAGVDGVLITRPYCNLEDIVSGVDTDTAGDSTSVIAAQGAGIKVYVTSVIVKNTHATTDAYIDLRDGTAGTVKASIPAPAASGAIVNFPVPLPFSANTAVAVDPSAAVTTIITTVIGFKSKV